MSEPRSLTVTRIAQAALSSLIILGILTYAGTRLHEEVAELTCRTASRAVLVAGIVACALAISLDLVGKRGIRCALDAVIACCGVFVALAPGMVFPLCADTTLHCHAVMRPYALAHGAALATVALIDLLLTLRSQG